MALQGLQHQSARMANSLETKIRAPLTENVGEDGVVLTVRTSCQRLEAVRGLLGEGDVEPRSDWRSRRDGGCRSDRGW